ncbi:MAG: cytochrome c biogenesis protein [Verrucomicrobiae bacterium]|nr:cytochrome c biogenesis protein [Verrucomicrobiae bacterium]NNJ42000.1 cytochrome c biogenesis protein CcsA [Akkermansiaceae bacterium]
MDRWILILALVLAAIAAVQGAGYVYRGHRSRWTVLWMLCSFLTQLVVLGMRSELRGSCPLGDTGEILLFSAWSLTMFYMVVGSVYRLSLLGVFTAPLVCFLLTMALVPGMLEVSPHHADTMDAWREGHAAFSVLAYGSLGLAAVAGVMFLVLNRQLKEAQMGAGLFRNLPPARELSDVVRRLLILGFGLLTIGLVCGLVMEKADGLGRHLIVALGQWFAYGILIGVEWRRGMPARKLAILTVALFVLSLMIFPLLK